MEYVELLDSVVADVATVTGVLATDAAAAVPHCPGWAVRDLVAHHGGVLRWATKIVRTGEEVAESVRAPVDLADLADWYVSSASGFVVASASTDPDRACWTFGRPPGRTWFWFRRQALEAAVHRWDAETAVGRSSGFAPEIGSAGISEVVDNLFPRQVALGRTPGLSGSVELMATDTNELWTLGDSRDSGGGATVEASTEVLLLLLWRRVDMDDSRVKVTGPTEIVKQLRTARFAP